MLKLYYTFWVLFLSANFSFADNTPKTVKIAVGTSMAPYVSTSGRGIVNDLLTESLAVSGYTVELKFLSNEQAMKQFQQGSLDAIAIISQNLVDGYYSVPYITFRNHAITVRGRAVRIERLADLKGRRIIGFSKASKYLGPEFEQVIADALEYQEMHQQIEQVQALLAGKTEVVIADKRIFTFYKKVLQYRAPLDVSLRQELEFQAIFPEVNYSAAFNNPVLRDAFNRGYQSLQKSGRAADLKSRYDYLVRRYGSS